VAKFKYFGMTVTNQNLRNACYHSVQNLLSSHLMFNNLKIKMYRIIILPVVLCGRETWSLTLREEHKLRVYDNRLLRRTTDPNWEEIMEGWRKLHNELYNLYSSPNTSRMINSKRMRWVGYVAWMSDEKCIRNPGLGKLKGRDYLEDFGINGRILLEWTLGKQGGKLWTLDESGSG
jgi:hypothetical protein